MKKELEFLYEGNCNENPFVFETPNCKNKWILYSLIFRKDMQKKDKKPCVNYAKIGREMRLSLDSKQQ
ncbi:MAG: hypothetical protein ACLS6W_09500 [Ruminococcus sp.]